MVPSFLALSEFIQDAFGKIFDFFISPLIRILWWLFSLLADQLFTLLSAYLRHILYSLLHVVEFCENIFNVFSGVQMVKYDNEQMYLLDAFLTQDSISLAFGLITVIGVVLCFIFTIYSVGKSMSDHILENKHPVGHVMKQGLKAAVTFAVIPLMLLVGVRLSSTLMVSTDRAIASAMGSNGTSSMTTMLFLSGTTTGNEPYDSPSAVKTRAKYISGQVSIYDEAQVIKDFDMDFKLSNVVGYSFSSSKNTKTTDVASMASELLNPNDMGLTYNYAAVFIATLFTIIILLMSIITFVRRIIEVVLLYVTAPLFVSSMTLDDGHIFQRWRELFIGKLLSGFGIVFIMKMMLMLIPIVMSEQIRFTSVAMFDMLLKLIFVIGGLVAAFKGGDILLEIISPQAAAASRESAMLVMGAVKTVGTAAATIATGGAAGVGAAAGGAGAAAGGAGAVAGGAGAAAGGAGAAAGGAGAAAGGAGGAGGAFTGGGTSGGLNTGASAGGGAGGSAGGGAGGSSSGSAKSGGSETSSSNSGGSNDNKSSSGDNKGGSNDNKSSSGDNKGGSNENKSDSSNKFNGDGGSSDGGNKMNVKDIMDNMNNSGSNDKDASNENSDLK